MEVRFLVGGTRTMRYFLATVATILAGVVGGVTGWMVGVAMSGKGVRNCFDVAEAISWAWIAITVPDTFSASGDRSRRRRGGTLLPGGPTAVNEGMRKEPSTTLL
jgi:hypothetical protein